MAILTFKTPKILVVILFTVFKMILIMLVWRILYRIMYGYYWRSFM